MTQFTQFTLLCKTDTQMGFPLTWPSVKAIFIVKVHTVHTVNAGLRDRHTDGFAPDKAFSNSKLNS